MPYPIRIKVSHILVFDIDMTCTLYAGELLH